MSQSPGRHRPHRRHRRRPDGARHRAAGGGARVRGHAGRRGARHRRARARRRSASSSTSWSRRRSSTPAERDADRWRASSPPTSTAAIWRRSTSSSRRRPRDVDVKREIFDALDQRLPRRRRAGHQHVVDQHHRDRRGGDAARARDRHALHEPAAAHEAGRDHPRPARRRRDLRDDARAGRAAGQEDGRLARHPGLHRQPRADADAERGLLRALRGDRRRSRTSTWRSSSGSTIRWGRSR